MYRLSAVESPPGELAGPAPLSSLGERSPRTIDLGPAERAAADLLRALGADLSDERLRRTPRRVAESYAELLTPEQFDLTTFPNDGGYDELVVAKAIPFHSLCEHHMLPFIGVAHVGDLPLQVQEHMTKQIADWLEAELAPKGVGVVFEAEHLCMSLRGVQKTGSTTVTSALHGLLRDDALTRQEFLALARG